MFENEVKLLVKVRVFLYFELVVFYDFVGFLGFLVIGLVVFEGYLIVEEVWLFFCVDENW